MANKLAQDLRELDDAGLRQELQDAQRSLTDTRFRLVTRQTENTAQLNNVKRQIARIRTILAEREVEA
jgi:large subunit ribosomal protein L29